MPACLLHVVAADARVVGSCLLLSVGVVHVSCVVAVVSSSKSKMSVLLSHKE